jgi:hypothetical protein
LIWEDNYGPDIGKVAQTNPGYEVFKGPSHKDYPSQYGNTPGITPWFELEEEGDGNGCGLSVNQAVHTRVELGHMRMWHLGGDNVWRQFANTANLGGSHLPNPGDPYFSSGNFRSCTEPFASVRNQHMGHQSWNDYISPTTGFKSYKPLYYWVMHGWTTDPHALVPAGGKAVFIQMYARLIVEPGQSIDDRHLARYVVHVAADSRTANWNNAGGDIGVSRNKRITNDWQPINFITGGITKEQLIANPPPFTSVP